jgi:hypothetical protein
MANIDRQIADEIAAANGLSVTKLGLRFDKVVVRLLGCLRACVEHANPSEQTVLMTITAPIKLPGKTRHELETIIRDSLDCKSHLGNRQLTVFQNEVQLRIIESCSKRNHKFVGFVHNPGTNPTLLLDLASQWLMETENAN